MDGTERESNSSENLSPESPMRLESDERVRSYFQTLYRTWGRQHWWPAQSRFEVIAGAYLTQNTSWTNVELALASLRRANVLNVRGIRRTPLLKLETMIRPAGYFRQKAQRLKIFVRFLDTRYAGSLSRMFAQPTATLREELLALNGIGPETADSILLYAGHHPVFVVDAYTRRILERHQLATADASYEDIREMFEQALQPLARSHPPQSLPSASESLAFSPPSSLVASQPRGSSHPPSRMSTAKRTALVQVFNEMHGLIVGVGKNYCKKSQPECEHCPLQPFLPQAK
jgi:endonuclease-3 related protein